MVARKLPSSVQALIVVVAVAAIIVGGTAWWLVNASSTPANPSGGCPPCGAPLALSTPSEIGWGDHHWYNFTVESGGTGLTAANLVFQVQDPSGSMVPPVSDWSLQLQSATGSTLAVYSWTASAWTSGGASPFDSGYRLIFDSGSTDLSGQGMTLVMLGTGAYAGSVQVGIP